MRNAAPLPPGFDSDAFSTVEAEAIGVSRGRLRAGDLENPFRGVRMPVCLDATAFLVRLEAYRVHMGVREHFSHVTAAQIYGIPIPLALSADPTIHVSVSAPAFPPHVRGVRSHRIFVPLSPRIVRDLRVISPERTFTQLSGILSLEALVMAGDDLVRRKRPLCTLAGLAAAVDSMGPARGARRARRAIPLLRGGTDSPMESLLRLLIANAGLPEPEIGYTVRDQNGDFVATPDLSYVAERIAIEYEGSIHQSDPRVYAEDIARRALLSDAGWLVILVIKSHLNSPHMIVDQIRRALRERAHLALLPQQGDQ